MSQQIKKSAPASGHFLTGLVFYHMSKCHVYSDGCCTAFLLIKSFMASINLDIGNHTHHISFHTYRRPFSLLNSSTDLLLYSDGDNQEENSCASAPGNTPQTLLQQLTATSESLLVSWIQHNHNVWISISIRASGA